MNIPKIAPHYEIPQAPLTVTATECRCGCSLVYPGSQLIAQLAKSLGVHVFCGQSIFTIFTKSISKIYLFFFFTNKEESIVYVGNFAFHLAMPKTRCFAPWLKMLCNQWYSVLRFMPQNKLCTLDSFLLFCARSETEIKKLLLSFFPIYKTMRKIHLVCCFFFLCEKDKQMAN